MAKPLNRLLYKFLNREMNEAQEKGIISKDQKEHIMNEYEEGQGLNVIWVIASVGAILVGLGFLLVVANNWEAIGDFWKLMIIVGATAAALVSSLMTETVNRYTSKGLLYLSVLIYGSGIFLVVDAYDINMVDSTMFFLWAVGALALSVWKRDTILLIGGHILASIGILVGFDDWIVVHVVVMTAVLIGANHIFDYKPVVSYFLIAAGLLIILYFPIYYELNGLLTMFVFVFIGNLLYYLRHSLNREAFMKMGLLTMGIAGFALSFKGVWETWDMVDDGGTPSVIFSILFVIYMMVLLTHKRIIPLLVIGAFIIRYYFDSLYDFLPRALFFVIGGLLLLGIGFFIERYYEKVGKDIQDDS